MNMWAYVSVLRSRSLALFILADAVSVLGHQIGWVGLLWLTMTDARPPQAMGWLGLAFGLPGVALGPVVGHVLDSTSHERVMVASHALLGALFISIAALQTVHALPMALLLMLGFAAGCLTPFSSIGWSVVIRMSCRRMSLAR